MARSRFAVFGAGRYGTQIALSLARRGAEVFTFDANADRAELLKEDVSLAVTLDSTDKKALLAQHVQDLDAAVVAIGENFEATVLTTSTCWTSDCHASSSARTTPTRSAF